MATKLKLTQKHILVLKSLIHFSNLGFIVVWYYWALTDDLGADPVKTIIHFTGMGALNMLLLTLFVSPLVKQLKQAPLMKTRRLLGVYSFVWASLHFANYLLFDLQLAWGTLLEDILKRPYITVGFVALVLLLLLAFTSPNWVRHKMAACWQQLHNQIYLAALLIAIHFIWSLKAVDLEVLFYWGMLSALLAMRAGKLKNWWKRRQRTKSQR